MPIRPLSACLIAALLSMLAACSKDDGGDTGASESTTMTASASATEPGATSEPGTTSEPGATSEPGTATDETTGSPTTATTATTGTPTTGDGESTASDAGETTAPAPTDGPGVLPGETGIDSFCRRYVECGGTYYADAQACLDESFGYWGECPTRRAALDAFGGCMAGLDCSEWNPDAYNPGSTPCAQQWSDLNASESC